MLLTRLSGCSGTFISLTALLKIGYEDHLLYKTQAILLNFLSKNLPQVTFTFSLKQNGHRFRKQRCTRSNVIQAYFTFSPSDLWYISVWLIRKSSTLENKKRLSEIRTYQHGSTTCKRNKWIRNKKCCTF